MNLKELIFGEGVHTGGSGGVYRDSVQAWLPIKNIIGGVVITKDNRFVKIMEVLPVNIYLKSAIDRQNIISSFASYLQIAPDELQMIARTLPADTQAYVEQMQRYAEQEENEACREMIEDNIREIGHGIAGGAMRHRFFLVFQYEPSMRAKRNTVQAIIQRLNEEADTARRYLDLCELEVLEPQYSDNFVLKLLYEILNKKTSQRVRLPEGVFDMAVPDYRVKISKLMLRSAYRPPPEDAPAWDATYQNRPFVIGVDMNLRRIDAAIASAKKRGCLPISLAALDAQGDAVLLRRYKDTGYAVIYKVTESVLTELFGHPPSLYLPPCTQYLTKKGAVVDAPLIQVDRKDRGSPRK